MWNEAAHIIVVCSAAQVKEKTETIIEQQQSLATVPSLGGWAVPGDVQWIGRQGITLIYQYYLYMYICKCVNMYSSM